MRRAVKCAELCVLLACAAADKDKSKKDKNAVVAGAGAGGSGGLLIDDELAREEDVEFITFEGRSDGKLYANGQPFALKGINWFGSEGRIGKSEHVGPPGGLDVHSTEWYCSFIKQQGFNAVRLLFNHRDVLESSQLSWDERAQASELDGLSYLEMFVQIARQAARQGLIVLMACHRLNSQAWPGGGLWYDGDIDERAVRRSWSMLGAALCGQWNVFAVDLQNEPHQASWGAGRPTDWDQAATRLGNHVLAACPRWLILVEGVGGDPGSPGDGGAKDGFWWGGNLFGARAAPVKLSDPSKLVYSPHAYGPSVYMQGYFSSGSFPANMAAVWERHWAFVQASTGTPVVIGELGGWYTGRDRQWQDWAIGYVHEHGMGLFYFALNPTSKDTGGILLEDWTTINKEKLQALGRLPSTDVRTLLSPQFIESQRQTEVVLARRGANQGEAPLALPEPANHNKAEKQVKPRAPPPPPRTNPKPPPPPHAAAVLWSNLAAAVPLQRMVLLQAPPPLPSPPLRPLPPPPSPPLPPSAFGFASSLMLLAPGGTHPGSGVAALGVVPGVVVCLAAALRRRRREEAAA